VTITSKRNMLASYADGAAYSLMVGFGETYIAAFALAVGLSQVVAGLTGTLPLVAGGLLQLVGPKGARWLGSYRRWVLCCAALQGAAYVPLALAATEGRIRVEALFLIAALYWGTGMAAGPTWNNWIDAIIPKPILKEFLAVRSRITQLAAFLAFLGGGYLLHFYEGEGRVLTGFALLFALAFGFRLVSVGCLATQSDADAVKIKGQPTVKLRELLARFKEKDAGRFLLFLLVSQVSVNLASPFFSPYMLAHVQFTYMEYVTLVSGSYVAKIVFYPAVARFVKRVGAHRALWISGVLVSPLPLFWFWMPQLYPLIASQVFAGAAWATFELSSMLMIFDRITAKERIKILAIYNLFNALAVTTGSLLGGLVLTQFPEGLAYRYIFVASACSRLLSLLVLVGIREFPVKFRRLAFRTLGLRPSSGSVATPILVSDESKLNPLPTRKWFK
jgi:MFS family permease